MCSSIYRTIQNYWLARTTGLALMPDMNSGKDLCYPFFFGLKRGVYYFFEPGAIRLFFNALLNYSYFVPGNYTPGVLKSLLR